MKNNLLRLILLLSVANSQAQNVGIGTATPSANLEVKNSLKSVLKISSTDYLDSSHLIFSNRNGNSGTDMILAHDKEIGLKFSSKSDLASKNVDNIMMITASGRVGIRNNSPAYPLDLNGDMNLNGNLSLKGSSGLQGQVLGVNSTGQNQWVDVGDLKHSWLITGTSAVSFPVPAGVSFMVVEQWGGGGGGGEPGGGASGTYARYTFNTTLISSLAIKNGIGGAPGTPGTSGTVQGYTTTGGTTATFVTGGGGGSVVTVSVGQPSLPNNYFLSATSPLIGYLAMPGKGGKTVLIQGNFNFGGDGGDAVLDIANGGNGSSFYLDMYSPNNNRVFARNGVGLFSSGGGGGLNEFPIINRGAKGGDGVTILRW